MALVTQNLYQAGANDATVDLTFDDTNGAIQSLTAVVNSGHLTITVTNPPRPQIVRVLDAPSSQTISVPQGQGYTLTKGPKGDWRWTGTLQVNFHWDR
jgi:hypothetical protein